jgi:Holliday junction resolvasome RuvABC endonuclease subunit
VTLVLGVDPSLTSTGYAWSARRTGRLRPGGTGVPRLTWLREAAAELVEHLLPHGLVLVVYESPAWGKTSGGGKGPGEKYKHENAAAWWTVLEGLSSAGVPVALVNPTYVKMYATGRGSGEGTDKPAVVANVRQRFGYPGTDNNEADALALAALGYDHLGIPLARLPQQHRRAVGLVTWPAVPHPTRAALGG